MKKHNYPGLFIAFEGIDGSGSSTQADLLVSSMKNYGLHAFYTKEPTNNLIGGLIRAALTKSWEASPECLQLLYTADRAHHLQREIIPALEQGKAVVTDRYLFSTIAFGSPELDSKWLFDINARFILPDITFYIRVPVRECMKRIKNDRNEFELFEEEKKLRKVLSVYDKLAKENYHIITINGEKSITQIKAEILLHVNKLLKAKKTDLSFRNKNLFSI